MNELVKLARQFLERQQESLSIPSPIAEGNDWLARWRELASTTSGLSSDDPRLNPVLSALAASQHAHEAGNLEDFTSAAAQVRRLMQFVSGATMTWEGRVDHQFAVLGPATVEHVHCDRGRLHVFVTWNGTGRWVSELIVREIREPR